VLDSYQNDIILTPGGAIYGENPPLVNATGAGQWQARHRFPPAALQGRRLTRAPARMTVFLNGF